jgi:hypothetical protein
MITTRFIGRLGNSMFQLAACIAYAKKYGYAWAAPADARESSIHQVFPNLPKTNTHPGRMFPKRGGYDPEFFDYFNIPNVGNDLLLAGYFQSLKFFENAQEEVKEVFNLDIDPIDAVSIHVRRGDYVTYAGSFPPVTVEYIHEAIVALGREIAERELPIANQLIVFSDDIEWCKRMFGHDNITYSEGRTEREDLSLMASCKHHIIANSSFSWWGAYLGHNPDKIIVCPHRESWYGPDNGVVQWYKQQNKTILPDMIPDGWIQIKFR